MTYISPTSLLNVEFESGKPPILHTNSIEKDALRAFVAEHGALLVRGLELSDVGRVAAVFRELGQLMNETESFAPRKRYAEGVYSATKWPPNQPMCVHHELSYALEVPSLMFFVCLVAPQSGGATPLADSATVLAALPPALVQRFEQHGWLLIRNYNEDIGASVADVFGTDDRRVVERYCRANAIEFEWRDGGGLRTRQRRNALVRHPINGRRCWFNQIAFLNEWTLAPEVRDYLVDVYGRDGLPFNTCFGNGDPIDAGIVEAINETYEAHTVRERWKASDLLIVDNIRIAHGREPFDGPRELVAGLADGVRLAA